MNPHYILTADWLAQLQVKIPASRYEEFVTAYVTEFRYHGPTRTMVIAAWAHDPHCLRLYHVQLDSFEVTEMLTLPSEENHRMWLNLGMSPDGRFATAAYWHSKRERQSGGVTFSVWEGKELRFQEADPDIPLRYQEDNETYQFFCQIHPDSVHCSFWMYANQRLRTIDMRSGEILFSKSDLDMDSLGISEDGSRLLVGDWNQLRVWKVPLPNRRSSKSEFELMHGIGYYYWGATALCLNASRNLAIAFLGSDRCAYRDINMDVTDFDSHLIMWQKQSSGEWATMDVIHFEKFSIEGHDSVTTAYTADKIYWAGLVDCNNILVVAFPSLQRLTIDAELRVGSKIWLSHDATRIYCGEEIRELRWYPLPEM